MIKPINKIDKNLVIQDKIALIQIKLELATAEKQTFESVSEWIKIRTEWMSDRNKDKNNYYMRVCHYDEDLKYEQQQGATQAKQFIKDSAYIIQLKEEQIKLMALYKACEDFKNEIAELERQIKTNCSSGIKKLVPNLCNKTKYVLHYRNLKLYIQLGLVLKNVHRVLSFTQTTYLKQYIDFNTSKRAQSKNDFEKDLFKLFNNAIFGKTCENVDKRIEVQLVSEPKKFVNQASKPYFKDFRIFSNNLVACEMRKTQVKYNRPMIVGMCILDLSKVLMYDFHYNTMVKTYGTKAKLCFTDTDSLTYHIETPSFYEDMKKDLSNFDTSDYPKDHLCYSEANKKIIGKFKDETNAVPILEFIGLRAKMYSIKLSEEKNKATAKGIKKSVTKALKHEKYSDAIFGTTDEELRQSVSFNLIRSQNHQVNTIKINKVGLCAYDDKRYILEDNINSYAHGHHMIKQ